MQKAQKRSWHRLPNATEIGGARFWSVYETECPEEGGTPWQASSETEAIRLHRKATGDKKTDFTAVPVTKAQFLALSRSRGA